MVAARQSTPIALVLVTALAIAGCAGGADNEAAYAVAAGAPVAAAVPAPELNAEITRRTVRISWTTPAGLTAPVEGYYLYLDRQAPLALPATKSAYEFGSLEPGDHYVQVVAVTATGRSRPAGHSVAVPYQKRKEAPEPAPSSDESPASSAVDTEESAAETEGSAAETEGSAAGTEGGVADPKAIAADPEEGATADAPAGGNSTPPAASSFTASGLVHFTRATGLDSKTPCDDINTHYKVQTYEEHEAYEGDAILASSGKLIARAVSGETVTWTCAYNFSIALPGTSAVYQFKLMQHRMGMLKDEQTMTTSRLQAGNGVLLTA